MRPGVGLRYGCKAHSSTVGAFLQVAKVEEAPTPSAVPVMEMELTEEKLPMSLSRQEVSPEPWPGP